MGRDTALKLLEYLPVTMLSVILIGGFIRVHIKETLRREEKRTP